jgi:queuine tRNA-ribosyltransferase catalytic subunit
MNWSGNILTDSGGFQMVSLSKLCKVTEEGVEFQHPETNEVMFLRPEDSIAAQNNIGSDIMMALDDVVQTTTQGPRMEEACDRTIRWIDRNIAAHRKPLVQNLFPIVQGGLDTQLREKCLKALVERDANGYAIGGLSGGEAKDDFFRIVAFTAQRLPENKPRYLMGVGYPVDILLCACLGVDMFDCVYPTRTARFGTAFTRHGNIKLTLAKYKFDFSPVEESCLCEVRSAQQACRCFTKAYFNSIITREEVAAHLLSKHNIFFNLSLMRKVQQAIKDKTLKDFAR